MITFMVIISRELDTSKRSLNGTTLVVFNIVTLHVTTFFIGRKSFA
jgi:hypothetical protein